MRRPILAAVLALAASQSVATSPTPPPKALQEQVGRLVELLRDSHATGYPAATLTQTVDIQQGRKLVITVFTIEAYGGGNNHTQFLALFEREPEQSAKREHYTLLDVMPIGGKGGRAVHTLKLTATHDAASGRTTLLLPVLEPAPGDALNFPSRPATVRLVLEHGRLSERRPR
jgi:hypothetical protein